VNEQHQNLQFLSFFWMVQSQRTENHSRKFSFGSECFWKHVVHFTTLSSFSLCFQILELQDWREGRKGSDFSWQSGTSLTEHFTQQQQQLTKTWVTP
jgi:hypothetical protein